MQIHDVKPKTKRKKRKLVGRGGKRGKTSGKGHKGQKARAGRKMRPELRDIIKKVPKKRGYRFKKYSPVSVPVNLDLIDKNFKDGDVVSPRSLLRVKIIKKKGNKFLPVKILGVGDISKKVKISGCLVSKTAEEKIKKIGGTIAKAKEEKK